MSELAQNTGGGSLAKLSPQANVAVQILESHNYTSVAAKLAPTIVLRDVARLFAEAIFGKSKLARLFSERRVPTNAKDGRTPARDTEKQPSGRGQIAEPQIGVTNGQNESQAGGAGETTVAQQRTGKETETENQAKEQKSEGSGQSKNRPLNGDSNASSKLVGDTHAWGMKQAIDRISDALAQVTAQEQTDQSSAITVNESHQFTLVELEDDEPGQRKFKMYAEDDELLLEPWQLKFSDTTMQIEVFVRDAWQLPLMVNQAATFESELSASTGLRVVLSFNCPSAKK